MNECVIDYFHFVDSCLVNNGECEKNAICSHDTTTFAVICTCKTGFTNVGSDANVTCQGSFICSIDIFSSIEFDHFVV